MQVHDELVLDVFMPELEQVRALVRRNMSRLHNSGCLWWWISERVRTGLKRTEVRSVRLEIIKNQLPLRRFSGRGVIGSRARLRIWCRKA